VGDVRRNISIRAERERRDERLNLAAVLQPVLDQIDGFVSVERCASKRN
jgi:hypothetical protein